MAGFVRRWSFFPSLERLLEIEAVNIIDLAPPAPSTGVGSGTLLAIGEFEDGPFAAGGNAPEYIGTPLGYLGIQEVFSPQDQATKYGGFGFTYGSVPYSNPCSRRHLSEMWNGSGFIKLKYIRPLRLLICRVDTSVGEVAFSPRPTIYGGTGPFALAVGQTLSITTSTGGPTPSTAIAATRATVAGANVVTTGFVGGETIGVTIDGGAEIPVVFTSGDQTEAQIAARLNAVLGYTAASVSTGVDIVGIQYGTGGKVVLRDITAGTLAAIGHVAGTTNGTGNVANLSAVTAAEVAAIVVGTAGLASINASASVEPDGRLALRSTLGGASTISVAAGAMATALALSPIGSTVTNGVHGSGTIPAGTRVRTAGGLEWVTMQTLAIAAGTSASPNIGPHVVKVRPATDDGTAVGASSGTVTTVVDQPTFAYQTVTNPAALSAAKDENQMDTAYEAAWNKTLDLSSAARQANYSICARRSTAMARIGRSNAVSASDAGHFGRKFLLGAPVGYTVSQAQADVALWRSERVFYCYPGWKVRIPEIAERGVAGGVGFTSDGVITVRGEGPLATIDCQLNPEENPGQQTTLITDFFAVESTAETLDQAVYTALKAAGICAPRVDAQDGPTYQSGVTSSLDTGRTTQARRKYADFAQDSQALLLLPFLKKLDTLARRDSVVATLDGFLSGQLAEENPERQRIAGYSIDITSGNTEASAAAGIFVIIERIKTLASMDAIVLQTEIGTNVLTITELAA